jgi:VWFA-related protein
MRRFWIAVLISWFAATGAAVVQQQVPVFRSRIDLARLDVTVIDNKTGKPVPDLKEADFTVIEDGARQKITTFVRELIAEESVTPAASVPASARGSLAARSRRVLGQGDRGGINRGPVKPYDGARAFIRERLLPQDVVSVMAFNRATDLTTDRDYLIRVIDRLQAARDAITYDMFLKRPLTPYVPVTDMAESTQANIDAIFHAPGSSEAMPRSVPAMLIGTEEFRLHQAAGERRSRPRPWNNMVVGSDLLKIYAGIEYLRHVEGEKHVICMTTGMFMPIRIINMPPGIFFRSREDNARLAARANDAQVVIDIIGTAGTFISVTNGGRTFSGGTSAGEIMSSETASELSGGQYTSLRIAADALARIDDASRVGYILGYTPTNPDLDGKYRKVAVKVNRRDVTVLFRHGYTASNDVAPIDLREIVTSERLQNAAAAAFDSDDLKVDAAAVVVPAAGTPGRMQIDLKIDASRLSLERQGDRHTGLIDLVILCGDDRQNVVCSLKQQMTLDMDEAHYQIAMRDGIPYRTTLPLTGQASFVKVLVYDFGADLLASRTVKVR